MPYGSAGLSLLEIHPAVVNAPPVTPLITSRMFARYSTGEGSDRFDERFKRWRGTLRDGGAADLIVELKQLRDTAASAKQRDFIQGEINYFEANRWRMNCRQYREQALRGSEVRLSLARLAR